MPKRKSREPDVQGLESMAATARLLQEGLERHIEDADSGEIDNLWYHLDEADGNLRQFIEELEKAIDHARR